MILKENKRIKDTVFPIFQPLIQPHRRLMEETFEPGFIKITWTSLNIEHFVYNVTQSLTKFEYLVNQTNSIYENRILSSFNEMNLIEFCDLNAETHLTVHKFLAATKVIFGSDFDVAFDRYLSLVHL